MLAAKLVGIAWLAILLIGMVASAGHVAECTPFEEDSAKYNVVDLPDGKRFYVYEDEVPAPFNTAPPAPLSGEILGGGTYLYEESNDLAGLQRGGVACFLDIMCTFDFPPAYEDCEHGSDRLVF